MHTAQPILYGYGQDQPMAANAGIGDGETMKGDVICYKNKMRLRQGR